MPHTSRRLFLAAVAGALPAVSKVSPYLRRAAVSLVQGEDRRRNVCNALVAIDDQIRPALKGKKYVLVKPNTVAVSYQLGSTHADALRGILDYLDSRFRGPIVIADSSRDNTRDAFENFGYQRVVGEFRRRDIRLVDFNEEGQYRVQEIVDKNLRLVPVRLAARLFDPNAFILGLALLKAHDAVVATLSVKNMVMAAPLHSMPKEAVRWHDKSRYHQGYRQIQMNLAITARRLQPFWGATVIDGFEGMEGEGPLKGTPVASRIAIASTDLVAADRIGLEAMGVNPEWVGYLRYCCDAGLGQYDISRIDLRGSVPLTAVRREYKLHPRLRQQLEWMDPS